ncbi:9536_t:CDS:2, partial [Scutellospora calospora]
QKYDEFHSNIFEPLKPLQPTDAPVTRCYNLNLIIKELAPDGYMRPVWTINGQYPGPIIQANYGDRLLINVTNNLGEPTSIHWHGIEQRGSNLYDGPPGMVQCPIPNDYSLLYNFTVNQTGTYWYHSHTAGQLIDGLKGPLIIFDPKDPHHNKYDFEYVITISDWYHNTSDTMISMILAHGFKGVDPMPDSGEISGKGQYNCSTVPKGSKCNPNNGIATYKIKRGKKYRFRIISISSAAHIIFSIDEHPLTIIEVD